MPFSLIKYCLDHQLMRRAYHFLKWENSFFMVFNDHLLRAFLVSLTYSAQFHIIHLGVAVDEEDMSGPWEWEMGEAQLW